MNEIKDLIANIPFNINSSKLPITNSVIQLLILGNNGGKWYIKIDDGFPSLITGYSGNPDLTISCTLEDLINLSSGELDPGKAFMTGKLTIQGDKTVALQLLELLKSNRN
jgi:putative sterol carrier protein